MKTFLSFFVMGFLLSTGAYAQVNPNNGRVAGHGMPQGQKQGQQNPQWSQTDQVKQSRGTPFTSQEEVIKCTYLGGIIELENQTGGNEDKLIAAKALYLASKCSKKLEPYKQAYTDIDEILRQCTDEGSCEAHTSRE
jgi:hypothetical protein